jgi:pimeloyl-ACP methyl ester carboxylesterase
VGVKQGERLELTQLQPTFDPLAPRSELAINSLALPSGRVARYIDEGDPDWRPFVFFGGLGTSVGAFLLTEFARSLRETLRLRVISVERNGFGRTPFDPSLGYGDGAADVLSVLAALDVRRFCVAAFSGGGPYAAALAVRTPGRLISLHLAAAAAGANAPMGLRAASLLADPVAAVRDPSTFWDVPAGSSVHRIPGFGRAAALEGREALGSGRSAAQALAHEWRLLRSEPLPDLGAVNAPAFLYHGIEDDVVPPSHADAWSRALMNIVADRRYVGAAHDIQYRHWDQILVDMSGRGERTLICREGRAQLVTARHAVGLLERGATLGLCAWIDDGLRADGNGRTS